MPPTAALQATDAVRDASSEEVPFHGKPTRQEIVDAIVEEALAKQVDCDQRTARRVFGLISRAVGEIRYARNRAGYYTEYHLLDWELRDLHDVFEAIMPDDVVNPPEGSAHALIHRHFLKGDEFAIVHTKTEEFRETGCLEYCAVEIHIDRA